MNNKLLYILIFLFLTAVVIFNIFLKTQPNIINTGVHTMAISREVLA
ncbi:MAG: hypothetical protein WCJ94_04025 [bacterium]